MTEDYLSFLFEDEERESIRPPLSYPGNKYRTVEKILDHLPITKKYVEPFGGAATVLLNKPKSKLEVYNDRYGGIVCFFRSLRDHSDELIHRLDATVYSREEFQWCKETWDSDHLTPVERAARWYYMFVTSFGTIGRNFGTSYTGSLTNPYFKRVKDLYKVARRLQNAIIENLDWEECMKRYDSSETVFYLDPDYVDTNKVYKQSMSLDRHHDLLDRISNTEGFVALSGMADCFYDDFDWDEVHTFESMGTIGSIKNNERNRKKVDGQRSVLRERLWIRYGDFK